MACLAAVVLTLSGCGDGAVEVEAPALTGPAQETCTSLLAALPRTVDGAEHRTVDPPDAQAAAWGDPAIVLRCGVSAPEGFDEFATCQETNGVGWFIPEEQMTGAPTEITMTTIGRAVNVEVTLPPEHWPPAAAMVDLAPAIKETVEERDPCV
ncbi:MAG TPA: DUF3515 domain-containing protein [Nocardioidaceae bacterium]|nr:DUF3515 domain-containing protein [Nocardioidaceae bacterium]